MPSLPPSDALSTAASGGQVLPKEVDDLQSFKVGRRAGAQSAGTIGAGHLQAGGRHLQVCAELDLSALWPGDGRLPNSAPFYDLKGGGHRGGPGGEDAQGGGGGGGVGAEAARHAAHRPSNTSQSIGSLRRSELLHHSGALRISQRLPCSVSMSPQV